MLRFCFCALIAVLIAGCTTSTQTGDLPVTTPATTPEPTATNQGAALYSTCAACHGAVGEGNKAMNAPALAGAEDWYLKTQLINFKSGIRGSAASDTLGLQMAAMAKTLKDSIQIGSVVAFIASMSPVNLPALITGDVKKGERMYQSICGSCHGARAKGNEQMHAPRLNGLDDWYIRRQVNHFKQGIRGSHPQDIYGQQMVTMAGLITTDESLDNLIAYIRSTSQPQNEAQ